MGRETEAQAKQLARLALNKLSQQAILHDAEPDTYQENCIHIAYLRHRDELSSIRRKKLWKKVQQKVQQIVQYTSNVRSMVRERKHGDVGSIRDAREAVGSEGEAAGSVCAYCFSKSVTNKSVVQLLLST